MEQSDIEVRRALGKFQDGYTSRNIQSVDDFMELFARDPKIEVIGTGASKRSAREWYEGRPRIHDIIEGDWMYWGDVRLDVETAKITVRGDVAWLSTTGTVTRTRPFDEDTKFQLIDMKAIFDRDDFSPDDKLVEATHYGMRRLRDRARGVGHVRNCTLTAVLVKEEATWKFHTIHWAMPVE